jgi:hypothetical protein
MMPIDFAISGAGDEAPILDFQRTTSAPVGLGSRSAARLSASNDNASADTRSNPRLHRKENNNV